MPSDADGRWMTRALVALTAVSLAAMALAVSAPDRALLVALQYVAYTLPGVLLVRAAAGPGAGWLAPLTFGPFIGFGASCLSLLALWTLGARSGWLLVVPPLLVMPLVPLARRARQRWPFPTTVHGDLRAIALVLFLVPAIAGPPLAHVGQQLDAGKAYRAYFTADYVWRRAVVAELAKGDMLPVNPFFTNDPLHYYWLPHLYSAVAYRTGGDLDHLLLMNSLVTNVAFVGFLYGFARLLTARPWAAAAGVVTAIAATSFEGTYALWQYWHEGAPLSLVRYLNIDAVSRWMLQGMPIDGLARVLFYQPHHATGYGLGFLGVLAVTTRQRRFDPLAFAVGGTLLGLSLLMSSFAGLMFTTVAALWEAASVLRAGAWWRASVHFAAAALPLALAAALVTALHYVDTGGSVISVGPNRVAFHRVLESTVLSFGPIIPIALLASWALWGARDARGLMFAALAITCVVYYFYVDIRDHQDVYVGWRVGHLWFIAMAALAAHAWTWLAEQSPGPLRTGIGLMLGGCALVALPTTVIDIYNTQDVYNWAQGPGFTWTLVLSPDEQDALQWIRRNTAPNAVFQLDALQRGVQGWAYLPAFAERRMSVGLPISMVPIYKYQQGVQGIGWIFDTATASSAHDLARKAGIDYLYIGSPERRRHPGAEARFDAAPEYFELAFRNAEASIYRVRR
ncbi:MAG: hypothetical protein IT178_19280 [Acidobacteria bacterium]|nr:hypothetical protein [Acidobacteriota bacterium]